MPIPYSARPSEGYEKEEGMRIRAVGLAALVAAALGAAACGGGGGGEGERLTKAEYIAQADAICKDVNDRLDALGAAESIEEFAELAASAVEIQEDGLADLKELKPPEEDQATIDEALALLDQQLALSQQIQEAAAAGDEAKVEELIAQIEPIDSEADQLAVEYGLTECGSG